MSDIQIRLGLARQDFTLDVNLTLPAQGITVLYGASGSGKTTLLRCVAGLEKAPSARVQIGDSVWQDQANGVFLPPWRRPLGYVFQESSLFDHLNVHDNLRFGVCRDGKGLNPASLDEAIALLGLGDLLQRRTHQLSGGERQRVAISRALALQPRLLLLDEPLASLDHARRQDILPWLERLRDEIKIPMLYVTHAADEVARLAHTLVVMENGKATAVGPVAEVLAGIDSPVILGDDVGALLEGTVQERDLRWHLAKVNFSGGALWLRDSGVSVGQKVRLRVLARDVSLASAEPSHTSIQNILPCVVDSIAPDHHPSQVLVRLRCGESIFLARITARSADALALAPGQTVWAQVKSVALVA
jgi:molybdate transport system ATP-binding protein